LVACCVGAILSKVRVVVAYQRCHGKTAGECEDGGMPSKIGLPVHGSSAQVTDLASIAPKPSHAVAVEIVHPSSEEKMMPDRASI
jgi:hypothetical protein